MGLSVDFEQIDKDTTLVTWMDRDSYIEADMLMINQVSFQDLLNKLPSEFYHPDDAEHMKEHFKQVMMLKGQVGSILLVCWCFFCFTKINSCSKLNNELA